VTGFLNDLGLKSASTDPNFLPEGKYPGFISDLQVKETKDKTGKINKALIITYKVTELDEDNMGKKKAEFKTLPKFKYDDNGSPLYKDDGSPLYEDETSAKNAAFLKQRLLSLGVPESELDTMSKEDLLGTPVWFEVAQRGEYYNVVKVELRVQESTQGLM